MGVGLIKIFPSNYFFIMKSLPLEFSLEKTPWLTSGGGGVTFVYVLIYISKAYIPNLRPLGPPLHVEKFVWWVGGGGGV